MSLFSNTFLMLSVQVIIKFATKEISKSPFIVSVEGAAGDATKVTASGPGLEKTGVVATKKTWFEVFTKGKVNEDEEGCNMLQSL